MAIKITLESFLAVLRRSNLIEAEPLKRLTDEFRAAQGEPPDAKPFADFLVQQKQITAWQAEKLLMGKHKGFFLGRYKLKGLLGKGGMSSVYLAEHVLMRRMCALKVLPARRVNDASYLGRFHREAQAVAALDHPNIVRAYDVDHEEDGEFQIHFLVMEYVEGKSLLDLVVEKGLASPTDAADYVRQAALGLEHAHRAGIIHRDIKPGNLLLDGGGTIKLLDMGLARFFGGDDKESLTIQHDEKVLGTADYLAPEQAVDSHKVDRRADIYSLGCSLYFLLTGHPPFNTGTLAQRLMAHQMKEPPDVTAVRSDVPQSLVAIMKKMMAKLPENRYATAGEAAEALEAWLETQGVAVSGASESGRMRKFGDSGAIKSVPALNEAVAAQSVAPTPATPPPASKPVAAPKPPAPAKAAPPSPVAEEGFAALGDLFGQMSQSPAESAESAASPAPSAPRTPAASVPPQPSAPVADDVPAFFGGGSVDTGPSAGFANLFESDGEAKSPPPVAAGPKPAAPARSPAKAAPAKGAAKPAPPKSPAKPATAAAPAPPPAAGEDVPDFLQMGGNGSAHSEEFVNPFADAAPSPPPASAAPVPKKGPPAPVPAASAAPAAPKAPLKGKPASAAPPRTAPPQAAASAPVAPKPAPAEDVPQFLMGGADEDAGSGGFADLFSDGPSAPAPAPPPPQAKVAPPPAAPKAPPKGPPAAAAASKVAPSADPDEVPAFLSGVGDTSAPIGDLFSAGPENPSQPPPAKVAEPVAPRTTTPATPAAPADDVPDFLSSGSVGDGAAGGIADLFAEPAAAPPPIASPPSPTPPKKGPAPPPAKAPAAPVADSDVPDFLKGGSSPPADDQGIPDFLGAASSPASPRPVPAKAPPKGSPAKGAAPPKAAPKPAAPVAAPARPAAPPPPAPVAVPSDVPDFLAAGAGTAPSDEGAEDLFGMNTPEPSAPPVPPAPKADSTKTTRPLDATPSAAPSAPTPPEAVPAFLSEGAGTELSAGGETDLFGIGAVDSAEPNEATVIATAPLASSDSPFEETVMALPGDDGPESIGEASGDPFGQTDSTAVETPPASRPQTGRAAKPAKTDLVAAAQAWLKVRRNQMIAGGGAAALLVVLLAVAFWPKGKGKPAAAPGAPQVAASLPSAAAAKGAGPRPKPQGDTLTVGPAGNFGTVSEAVSYFIKNVPADGSRRTIHVAGGYWYGEAVAVAGIGLSSPLTITTDAATPAVLRPVGGRPILNLPLANGLVLENLVLDANGAQGCAQIEAIGADSRLTNVEFRNFREFGLLTEAVSAEDVKKPIVIENCRFLGGAAGAKGLLVKTSTSTLFGLTVRQSQFQAPMRTAIEFGAGALGNVTVSQCRFVDVKTGLYFPPPSQDISDLLLLNNTFYRVQEGIVFNQTPAGSSQGMKSAVIGNLFVAPTAAAGTQPGQAAPAAGGDFVIRAGLTKQSWDAFVKGGPGVAGNMTDRGGDVGSKEVDIFSAGGGRRGLSDLAFESAVPGTAGFLKPTSAVSFPPSKIGEPYAGAVAP